MAKYSIEDTTLRGIADAIRSKTGGTDDIVVANMANEISEIRGSSVGTCEITFTTSQGAEVSHLVYFDGEKFVYEQVISSIMIIKVAKNSLLCVGRMSAPSQSSQNITAIYGYNNYILYAVDDTSDYGSLNIGTASSEVG